MKPDLVEEIERTGLEFMGCYRAADKTCYMLAGRAHHKDYGDKEGYQLDAWRESHGPERLAHVASLGFFASRSLLATARMKAHLHSEPALLKQLAVAQLKRMLDEGAEQREVILTSDSPDSAFVVDDPSGDPVAAQRQLRDEILRLLAVQELRGAKETSYDTLRDQLCASEDWIRRALFMLDKQGLLLGGRTNSFFLTADGHLAAENVSVVSSPTRAASTSMLDQDPKPMDCFVSYASEDRDLVKTLVASLTGRNLQIWWDRGQITLGDRLSKKIEEGLRLSRYGLVLISRHFVAKRWPDAELRALHARSMNSGRKVILPVLIGMSHAEFSASYPLLADLVTTSFDGDVDKLAEEVIAAIR